MFDARKLIVASAIVLAMICFIPHHVFRVSGKSMNPTLKTGDYLIVTRDTSGNLTHEIVVFEDYRNQLIAHRAIADNAEMIMTKGDANESSDGWITKENVIGFVLFVIPGEFIMLPPIVFIIMALVSIFELYKGN